MFEEWDAEAAVFDSRTGETHMISALPMELLRLLQQGPHDSDTLAARIAADNALPDDPSWRERVAESLQFLEQTGLIDRLGA